MICSQNLILDIVANYPATQKIFTKYDDMAGCCIMCTHLFDTVEELKNKYSIDIDNLLYELNKATFPNNVQE